MTISPQGSLAYISGTAQATLAVTPVNVGGVLVLGTEVASATISITSIAGGGVTTWTKLVGPYTLPTNSRNMELWFGPITSSGASTITITRSASVAGLRVDIGAQEFVSSLGTSAVWAADGSGGTSTGTSVMIQFPTLTPSGPRRLYFGYEVIDGGVGANPAPLWYTKQEDANFNQWLYGQNLTEQQSPNVVQAPSAGFAGTAALLHDGDADPIIPESCLNSSALALMPV